MTKIVTFGEILLRFEPKHFKRLTQNIPGEMQVTLAGAEANVAVALAQLGEDVSFVTSLPGNSLTDACIAQLRSYGVETSDILQCDYGRFGVFYHEKGVAYRPGTVLYDRDFSAISQTEPEQYPWEKIFKYADWFHISGITPALSEPAYKAAIHSLDIAADKGLRVSCDLNYRSKLWRWKQGVSPGELANEIMSELLSKVDLLITNEYQLREVFNIGIGNKISHSDLSPPKRASLVAEKVIDRFPNIQHVGMAFRESSTASSSYYGGVLYDSQSNSSYSAPVRDEKFHPYHIQQIVDRVGAGDAFAAGLIFAMRSEDYKNPEDIIAFAAASGCLAQTIQGDFNHITRDEIESLLAGSESGWIQR